MNQTAVLLLSSSTRTRPDLAMATNKTALERYVQFTRIDARQAIATVGGCGEKFTVRIVVVLFHPSTGQYCKSKFSVTNQINRLTVKQK